MEQLNLLAWTEPDRIEIKAPAQRVTIVCADIETVDLSEFGPFDALFSDPPYGLKFMGKAWDKGVPGPAIWAHLATFLLPGANVAAFGGTRTYHRLACAVEDAGLEIRDSMWAWAYASGWPKPANVAKYIDNHLIGIEWKKARIGRRARGKGKRAAWYKKAQKARFWIRAGQGVIGTRKGTGSQAMCGDQKGKGMGPDVPIVSLAHEEARAFQGWHGNLKPAVEPLVLARKPLDGTLANNALEHGVAGLNVDGCRIGSEKRFNSPAGKTKNVYGARNPGVGSTASGRWPTNFVLICPCADGSEHIPGCHVRTLDEQSGPSRSSRGKPRSSARPGGVGFSTTHTGAEYEDSGGASRFFKVIPVCPCDESGHLPGCHVRTLGEQSGVSKSSDRPRHNKGGGYRPGADYRGMHKPTGGHNDSGTSSRFFYCAKVSRKERGSLKHPTMKPLKLTEYYARLLMPPPIRERVLMVPCSGVKSEVIGAVRAGWERVVGIERDPEYCRQGAERIERETGIKVERVGFE